MGLFGILSIASATGGLVLYADLVKKTKELEKAYNDIKKLEIENEKLSTEKNTALEEHEIFKLALSGQEKGIKNLEEENKSLDVMIKDLKEQIINLKAARESLFEQILSTIDKLAAKGWEIEKLKEENANINANLLIFKELHNTLNSYVSTLEKEISTTNEAIDKLNSIIKELQHDTSVIIKLNKGLNIHIMELNGVVSKRDIHINDLSIKTNNLHANVMKLTVDIETEKELRAMDEKLLNTYYTNLKNMRKSDRNKAFVLAAKDISNIFLNAALGLKPLLKAE